MRHEQRIFKSICSYMTILGLIMLSIKTGVCAPIIESERMEPVAGEHGMVVTSHFLATQAALKVLQAGGNAIDAAVTAAFALAVVQPRSGNIGGGGFMLISTEKNNEVVSIDYREKAPALAAADMFLAPDGTVDTELSRYSHQAAGVPGTVAGLAMALEKYGTISWQKAIAPAIELAENGFIVTDRFSKGLRTSAKRLKKYASSRKIFYKHGAAFYLPGDLFVQKDLAATLKRISLKGSREFYEGKTATLLVEEMRRNGGLISREDLKAYAPVIRKPVHTTYRGYDIFSMAPPSSGGTHVAQILNILEGYPITPRGHNSAATIHLMAEAMKHAYADRSHYLGDADFVSVPLKALTGKSYAATLRAAIDIDRATPSALISPGTLSAPESTETTHFSIADAHGNAVSNTYTINFSYGSGIVVAGAGFLLNNEMDDFSAKPGAANAYSLLGSSANRIEPYKRMLSSMSPTIVKDRDRNFLITGSPGGSRIITTTVQVIMNVIDHGLNIQSAVSAPRIHHQWFPDELRIEEGISPDTVAILKEMGYTLKLDRAMGAANSILIKNGRFFGAADPRRSTAEAAGF